MKNKNLSRWSFLVSTLFAFAVTSAVSALDGAAEKEFDLFDTGKGELRITFLGHASLVFEFGGAKVYVDPVRQYGDYSKYPKADIVLVTHEHGDHLDANAIRALAKDSTVVILPESARKKLGSGKALGHGETVDSSGIKVEAVPAYNTSKGRTNFHPKDANHNGYILSIGKLRIYIAGDTEPIPEMSELGTIDIAFLPMNLPYTMTPEQVAEAARVIKPRILYPYHFGTTDISKLASLLADLKEVAIRVRKME